MQSFHGALGRHVLSLALVSAAIAAPFACSAVSDGSQFGAGGGGAFGAGATSGTTGEGGGLFGTGGGGGSCAVHCSADLHQVIDCNGLVKQTCPSDQGCGPGGACVSPCESASANGSTIGCDFYSVIPGPEYETRGSCFAVLLANTWSSPVGITADYGGTTFDASAIARTPVGTGQSISYQPLPNGLLDPGQIAVVFLSRYASGDIFFVDCPAGVPVGLEGNAAIDTTGIGSAFHIGTTAPVVAYDMYPYGGAASFVSSATLLVPTPAWGTNYIAADAYPADPSIGFVNGSPFLQIVAAEDGTNVTISPTAAIEGGNGVAPTGQGQPATYALGKGQVLQFLQGAELTGSPISSDKPISVWGGSACMNIPIGIGACDSGHQQLLPVKALGHEYLGVRYRDRVPGIGESIPYTLVGAVDGTTLTWDAAPPPGAPAMLASGQTVQFSTSEAFVVRSQDADHPFYFSAHMTGALSIPNNANDDGDPDYVTVIPPEQYLSRYLFLTDPTYRNTHLVVTRVRGKDGAFRDVTLDCVGTLSGFQPVGAAGAFEYTYVDMVVGGAPQGSCDNGVHSATSDAPFGLTVWGWDTTVSYAYPAGMSVQPINTVVVPPLPK